LKGIDPERSYLALRDWATMRTFRHPAQNVLEIYADIEPRSDARSRPGGDR
jgi:hypothetical protein